MPVTGRAASCAIRGGVRKVEILLNCREVRDVERSGDGGEERYGETRGRSLSRMGKAKNGERTSLNRKKRENAQKKPSDSIFILIPSKTPEESRPRERSGEGRREACATWTNDLSES